MDAPVDSFAVFVAILIVMITFGLVGWLKSNSNRGIPTVTDLKIYPIKSCGAITLEEANATETGFENDRLAQVSDADGKYCTPRDKKYEKLFQIQTKLKTETTELVLSSPYASGELKVDLKNDNATKTTDAVPVTGPAVKLQEYGDQVTKWIEQATGVGGLRLTKIGEEYKRIVEVNPGQNEPLPINNPSVSLADEAPYLLTSTSSLKDLNIRLQARNKKPVDMRRFRPNIVISGLQPWEEDSLKRIRIGDTAEFLVWQRCGRCTMTTIDRDTLKRGPEPLTTLGTFRERENGQRNFGMHMIPVSSTMESTVRVGDKIHILEYDEERKAEWTRLFGC